MKNKILMLGLAGLLGLSTNVSALETNVNGYEVPKKEKSELVGSNSRGYKYRGGEITINFYRDLYRKELRFNEVLTNGKPVIYYVINDLENEDNNLIIADENCDGKFEAKYEKKEGMKRFGRDLENIPACYFNKK